MNALRRRAFVLPITVGTDRPSSVFQPIVGDAWRWHAAHPHGFRVTAR